MVALCSDGWNLLRGSELGGGLIIISIDHPLQVIPFEILKNHVIRLTVGHTGDSVSTRPPDYAPSENIQHPLEVGHSVKSSLFYKQILLALLRFHEHWDPGFPAYCT